MRILPSSTSLATALPTIFLLFLATSSTLTLAQSPPVTLECDNTSLTTYLLSLLDLLYANGLTIYEDLIVALAQTDEGYEKLLDLFAAPSITLLVPTDAAFREAGMTTFAGGDDDKGVMGKEVELFVYHALQGGWDKMASGTRGVASTMMTIEEGMGGASASTSNSDSNLVPAGVTAGKGQGEAQSQGQGQDQANNGKAYQAMVLQKPQDQEKLIIRMAVGNSTTWPGPVDMKGHEILNNLVVLPIDKVIDQPPPLSKALTMATSTRSPKGFPKFAKTLGGDEVSELEKVLGGGFTIFGVVDDAFEGDFVGDVKAHVSVCLVNPQGTRTIDFKFVKALRTALDFWSPL